MSPDSSVSKSSILASSLPSLAKQVRMLPKLFVRAMASGPRAKASAVIKSIQSRIAIRTMQLASDRFGRSVNAAISAFRGTPDPGNAAVDLLLQSHGHSAAKSQSPGSDSRHPAGRPLLHQSMVPEPTKRRRFSSVLSGNKERIPGQSKSAGDTYESTANLSSSLHFDNNLYDGIVTNS